MAISILGGFLDGYNEDKKLEKSVNANALALGQKGVLDRRAAEAKQEYERNEYDRRKKVDAGFKEKKTFTVDFPPEEIIAADGTKTYETDSVTFPTYGNISTDARTNVFSIENLFKDLDTPEKVAQFMKAAESDGNWGPDPIEGYKILRDSYAQRWGPNGERDPIGVNVNLNEDHPFYNYFNQLKAKIDGIDVEAVKDQNTKIIKISPTADGGAFNFMAPGDDQALIGDNYLFRNEQFLGGVSKYTNMKGPDGNNIAYGEGVNIDKLHQASANDMFNRSFTKESDHEFIFRDWDNFFTTIGKDPELDQNGKEIPGTSAGLKLEVYVLNEKGETVLEDRYLSTGWDVNSWQNVVYGATNKTSFRNGAWNAPEKTSYNDHKDSPYTDLSGLADAGDLAEDQVFLALEIFSNANDFDPMSSVGGLVKFVSDAVLSPDSQMNQLLRGFNSIITGTIDAEWNGMSDDRKAEIRKANKGINNFMQMDKDTRDKMFADTSTQRALLNQIFTLLAYNVALTTQGGTSLSARVSNEDFDNAKSAVVGEGFDTLENRTLSLMQYYQLTVPKAFSFYLLDNEQGLNITARQRELKSGLIPTILNRSNFDAGVDQAGAYNDPYAMLNYLGVRPNSDSRMKVWAAAVKMAYRKAPELAYNIDFNPNSKQGRTALSSF